MVYRFFRQNWIPLALATGGLITRFLFIWHPAEVVFDEVHFGKFVNGYLKVNTILIFIRPWVNFWLR